MWLISSIISKISTEIQVYKAFKIIDNGRVSKTDYDNIFLLHCAFALPTRHVLEHRKTNPEFKKNEFLLSSKDNNKHYVQTVKKLLLFNCLKSEKDCEHYHRGNFNYLLDVQRYPARKQMKEAMMELTAKPPIGPFPGGSDYHIVVKEFNELTSRLSLTQHQ